MDKRRRLAVAAALWAAIALSAAAADRNAPAAEPYVIYLVRHAEKADSHSDPGLTPEGQERAARLGAWLANKKLAAIWSSDYRRTRETAAPAADRLGLQIRTYDPHDLNRLAGLLLAAAENALVVGHSNTTPELAALLCRCQVPAMSDTEYDRLIEITVAGDRRDLAERDQGAFREARGTP
jgi:phosphohistidine phosphatase SixA